jgi:hypothetical protein
MWTLVRNPTSITPFIDELTNNINNHARQNYNKLRMRSSSEIRGEKLRYRVKGF